MRNSEMERYLNLEMRKIPDGFFMTCKVYPSKIMFDIAFSEGDDLYNLQDVKTEDEGIMNTFLQETLPKYRNSIHHHRRPDFFQRRTTTTTYGLCILDGDANEDFKEI